MLSGTASRIAIASASALIASGALAAPASAQTSPAASHGTANPAQIPVIMIGPNQYFSGYINGSPPGQAIIKTDCFGPIQPGQTGHPLPNQPIEVMLATPTGTADLGYTGSAAGNSAPDSIVATLGPSSAAISPIAVFTAYNEIEYIPTTITVPCAGSGVVTFTASPAGTGAFPANLNVTFEGQP